MYDGAVRVSRRVLRVVSAGRVTACVAYDGAVRVSRRVLRVVCAGRVTACVACGLRRACHGVCCVWFAQGVSRRVACGFRRACTRGA